MPEGALVIMCPEHVIEASSRLLEGCFIDLSDAGGGDILHHSGGEMLVVG